MTFGTKRIQVRAERARVCAKKIAGLWEGGICAWEDRRRAGHGGMEVRPQGRTRSRRRGKYVERNHETCPTPMFLVSFILDETPTRCLACDLISCVLFLSLP